MDPEKKSLNFIFPTKYVISKSLSRLAIGQVYSWKIYQSHVSNQYEFRKPNPRLQSTVDGF